VAARARRGQRLAAWAALGLLAAASAVGFAANGREGPPAEARDRAARAAALQVAHGAASAPASGRAERPAAQPVRLIADAEQVPAGRHATRVRIAAVGIDAEVRSVGYTLRGGQLEYDVPRFEAGHYAGTADPGEHGNLVIGGHVTNRGAAAIFRRLPEVAIGDVVEVFRGDERFRYAVTELRTVAPEATGVMASGGPAATLTLITCSPNADQRYRVVVIGTLL
jgi:LPXTG-site transpeptidase (sortase) family protein